MFLLFVWFDWRHFAGRLYTYILCDCITMLSPSFLNISFLFPSFYHGWYKRPTLSITICTNFLFFKSSEFSTVVSLSLSLSHTHRSCTHTHRAWSARVSCTTSVHAQRDRHNRQQGAHLKALGDFIQTHGSTAFPTCFVWRAVWWRR